MTLRQYMQADFPNDCTEVMVGLRPVLNAHPPGLRNPDRVNIPMPQDGWHRGDSRQDRDQARQKLMDVLERGKRQTGKPEITRTANYPVFPSIDRWT